jgi:hypothetical protein
MTGREKLPSEGSSGTIRPRALSRTLTCEAQGVDGWANVGSGACSTVAEYLFRVFQFFFFFFLQYWV